LKLPLGVVSSGAVGSAFAVHPQAAGTSQGEAPMKEAKAAKLSEKLDRVYERRDSATPVSRQELQAMAEVYLGENYDRSKIDAVARLQEAMQESHKALVSDFKSGRINAGIYVDRLRAVLLETAKKCEQVLGAEDYFKLFGVTPAAAAGVLDLPAR
jgi:hypothetical protein